MGVGSIIQRMQRSVIWQDLYRTSYKILQSSERGHLLSYLKELESKATVGFSLSDVCFIDHVRDLIEAVRIDPGLAALVVVPGKWPRRAYKEETYRYLSTRYGLEYGIDAFAHHWLEQAAPSALIEVAATEYRLPALSKRILYAHGLAGLNFSKDAAHIRQTDRYDALFLTGPMQRRMLEVAARHYEVKLPLCYDIGYLRGDRLRGRVFDKGAFCRLFEIDEAPVVTYAPTWGEFSSTIDWIEKIVCVCEEMDVNLLLRLHPIMFTGESSYQTAGINWSVRLPEIIKGARRTRLATNNDIDDVLLASDVMITDVSGLGIEFLSLGKPTVFLPADKYFSLFGSDRPEMWCRTRPVPQNERELALAIEYALSNRVGDIPICDLVYHENVSLQVALSTIKDVVEK